MVKAITEALVLIRPPSLLNRRITFAHTQRLTLCYTAEMHDSYLLKQITGKKTQRTTVNRNTLNTNTMFTIGSVAQKNLSDLFWLKLQESPPDLRTSSRYSLDADIIR